MTEEKLARQRKELDAYNAFSLALEKVLKRHLDHETALKLWLEIGDMAEITEMLRVGRPDEKGTTE